MRRMILLLMGLLPALSGFAQILVPPNPHATSYMFFAGQLPRAVISPLSGEESEKFRQVYNAALQDDAALDAEGDALSSQMEAYRKALIAAMVNLDPKLAPLLGVPTGCPLTKAQSAEIRQAQSEAMQADADLQANWDDLVKKMTAHQQAVDAAMLKLDPTVAPILAKFSP